MLTYPDEWNLTEREEAIIRCLPLDMTNREIAQHLELSENTVKKYFKQIMRKAGVATRAAVAARVTFRRVIP